MAGRHTNASRRRILDATESLFIAHGYKGTSMRQIASQAKVSLAAMNYHFGSKEGLMREVIRRRLDCLNDECLRQLDALETEAAGNPLKPSQIIDAFFGTFVRLPQMPDHGGLAALRLLGHALADSSEFIQTFLGHESAHLVGRYNAALFLALPDVPKTEIAWRFHLMLGAMSYAIVGTDAFKPSVDQPTAFQNDRLARVRPLLMSFLLGGLVPADFGRL